MDSAISNESLLQADQSSRYRSKLNFFITLIIIFTIIVTAIVSIFIILKHNIDSQSLAANPSKSIQSICHLTSSYTSHHYHHIPKTFIIDSFAMFNDDFNSRPFDSKLCIKSLSSLARNQSRTHPSKIFNAVVARRYVVNSIVILENLDNIFDMFYPPKGSVLGSFLMTFDSFVSLGLFCSQFLLLAALFAVLLRLDRRK